MQIRDIMTHRVRDISPEATLREAAQTMMALDIGALPVCRDDKLIGVITDRDITVRAVAEGRNPESTLVGDVMSSELIFCHADDDVESAARLMETRQIRRLPVLDQRQRLIGMLSLGDIATRQANEGLSSEVLEHVSLPALPPADVYMGL
jgi:CBS domain-containing protein